MPDIFLDPSWRKRFVNSSFTHNITQMEIMYSRLINVEIEQGSPTMKQWPDDYNNRKYDTKHTRIAATKAMHDKYTAWKMEARTFLSKTLPTVNQF